MSIKDLFDKTGTSGKILSGETQQTLAEGIESEDYIKEFEEDLKRFIPPVDYSRPEKFARFGSAELYYDDSFEKILNTYPYDGSLKEKLAWHNSASYLDNYVFDNEYPRTTGYIELGKTNYNRGTLTHNWGPTTTDEYIAIRGGPHTSSTGDFKHPTANVYDASKNRGSNLQMHASGGFTVEWWMRHGPFDSDDHSLKQCVFDLWNGSSFKDQSYGRFRVEARAFTSDAKMRARSLYIEIMSGTYSSAAGPKGPCRGIYDGTTANDPSMAIGNKIGYAVTGNAWNHFALVVKNRARTSSMHPDDFPTENPYESDYLSARLYVNGRFNDEVTGSTIGDVTGSMFGYIGALGTTVSGSVAGAGYGKLSASIDEFRYWKTARTPRQIGRNWRTQVGGGTNTDDATTSLGIYYKFNEGITTTASVDRTVLDYSGRISNGYWVGYDSNRRMTGSAIIESSASIKEFNDPILYREHADFKSARSRLITKGELWDKHNNASIYNSIPAWITEEDRDVGGQALHKLTQIMSSYFDTLNLQIEHLPRLKDASYATSSLSSTKKFKPSPFSEKLLQSYGFNTSQIFEDITDLERYYNQNDHAVYSKKIDEIKNQIYQNIYNNLVYLYKSKGTEKAIRNLIRCFGVDDELIKINLYGNNITYEFKDNYRHLSQEKDYVNFDDYSIKTKNGLTPYNATVFQYVVSGTSGKHQKDSFITGTHVRGGQFLQGMANTIQCEVVFPKQIKNHKEYGEITFNYKSASIFGMHQVPDRNIDGIGINKDLRWCESEKQADLANFQLYACKDDPKDEETYFALTCTPGDGAGIGGHKFFLTSSKFHDVYENSKWNFAVSMRPKKYPLSDRILGSLSGNAAEVGATLAHFDGYWLELQGYNTEYGQTLNKFKVSASVAYITGATFVSAPKRIYLGAHRTNFSGAVREYSNVKVSSVRYWTDYLDHKTVASHSMDPLNYGTPSPMKNSLMFKNLFASSSIPQMDTLALHWDFKTVTGSDANGYFYVEDYSSGSYEKLSNTNSDIELFTTGSAGIGARKSFNLHESISSLGQIVNRQYGAQGQYFVTSSDKVIDRMHVPAARKQLPESLHSSDMIKIMTRDDELFTRNIRPEEYYVSIEKSMYQNISEEMINLFSTIKDFDNLIGEPVNRYRSDYKTLGKLRQRYFRKIENTPDIEKFIEYYKWFDNAITKMIQNLIPASARVNQNIRTVVESHILERNKYRHKLPSLEYKDQLAEGSKATDYALLAAESQLPEAFTPGDLLEMAGEKFSHGGTAGGINAQTWYDFMSAVYGSSTSPWKLSSPPPENRNCLFWKYKAKRSDPQITSGDPLVDSCRQTLLDVITSQVSSSGYVLSSSVGDNAGVYHGLVQRTRNNSPVRMSAQLLTVVKASNPVARNKKKYHFYKGATKFGTNSRLKFKSHNFKPEKDCLDDFSPAELKKRRLYGLAHVDTPNDDYTLLKDTSVLPMVMYSSSMTSGYLKEITSGGKNLASASVENLHYDVYYQDIPMQGPFTEKYVGGNQHRHIEISHYDSNRRGPGGFPQGKVDDVLTRPEGFTLGVTTIPYEMSIYGPEMYGVTAGGAAFRDLVNKPRAPYTREEFAKRPINIRNIKLTSSRTDGSSHGHGTILGNYEHNYQIVQASSRDTNNLWFRSGSSGVGGIGNNFVVKSSKHVSGTLDFQLPNRNFSTYENHFHYKEWLPTPKEEGPKDKYKSVIAERFSAPGDAATLSRGYLNVESEAYSAYNALPWRNLSVRFPLTRGSSSFLSRHQGKFGMDMERANTASYHKVHQNRVYLLKTTASLENKVPAITASQYDNWFVQHPIPRSDRQYSWITASLLHHGPGVSAPLGHAPASGEVSSSLGIANAFTFISASEAGSYRAALGATSKFYPYSERFIMEDDRAAGAREETFIPTDFVGMNHHILEPVTSSENILGYGPKFFLEAPTYGPSVADYEGSHYLNLDFVRYGIEAPYYAGVSSEGRHGAPMTNMLLLNRNGPYGYPSWKQIRTGEHAIARYHKKNNIISVARQEGHKPVPDSTIGAYSSKIKYHRFVEAPVSSKYKPLIHDFSEGTLVHTYANNLSRFKHIKLNEMLRYTDALSYPEGQTYDSVLTFYGPGGDNVGSFQNIKYTETIYPRDVNTYLGKTRARTNYAETSGSEINGYDRTLPRTFWRNTLKDRVRTSGLARNSMGVLLDKNFVVSASNASDPPRAGNLNGRGQPDNAMTFQVEWPAQDFASYRRSLPGYQWGNPKGHKFRPGNEVGHMPIPLSPWPLSENLHGAILSASYNVLGVATWISWHCAVNHIGPSASVDLTNWGSAGELAVDQIAQLYWGFPTASINFFHDPYANWYAVSGATEGPLGTDGYGVSYTGRTNISDFYFRNKTSGTSHIKTAPYYRANVISGRNPWYDSYEDYSEDIKRMGKDYSIIPEFAISNHMEHYDKYGFEANNVAMLQLDGAEVTSSATGSTNQWYTKFFEDYSFSDPIMHLKKKILPDHLDAGYSPKRITLKCDGIKKLLPYNGFYPVNRTVQMATLLSKSMGPYISMKNMDNKTTSYSTMGPIATQYGNDVGRIFSGAFSTQALMQPFFAPGIVYNTIKSGIAVDWPLFTGSLPVSTTAPRFSGGRYKMLNVVSGNVLTSEPNFRLEFDSLVDLSKIPNKNAPPIFGAWPSLSQSSYYRNISEASNGNFQWDGTRGNLFEKAMHNFLAETPNFFLKNRNLSSIRSKRSDEIGPFVIGNTYYMDVVLEKAESLDDEMVIAEGPRRPLMLRHDRLSDGSREPAARRGYIFGPPCNRSASFGTTTAHISKLTASHHGELYNLGNSPSASIVGTIAMMPGNRPAGEMDPCYAPYTPPYFYGRAVARIAYTADKTNPTIKEIVAAAEKHSETTFFNEWNTVISSSTKVHADGTRVDFRAKQFIDSGSVAYKAAMPISASLYLFKESILSVKDVQYATDVGPDGTFAPQSYSDPANPSTANVWAIRPKFECPVLDLSGSSYASGRLSHDAAVGPYFSDTTGRSIWMGYTGSVPGYIAGTNIKKGIKYSLRETYPEVQSSATGSLISALGFGSDDDQALSRYVGEVANKKEISEAIVAIPYIERKIDGITVNPFKESKTPGIGNELKPIERVNAIRINKEEYYSQWNNIVAGKKAVESSENIPDGLKKTSISEAISLMKKYVIPPEIDFVNFGISGVGYEKTRPDNSDGLEPFIMYLFEFKHELNQTDLINIWQNVMPDIAMGAEKDAATITHELGTPRSQHEFFGRLAEMTPNSSVVNDIQVVNDIFQEELKWMIFKVKKRAKMNYWEMLKSSKFNTNMNSTYNYNWPYDFCSLVELAKVTTEIEIG